MVQLKYDIRMSTFARPELKSPGNLLGVCSLSFVLGDVIVPCNVFFSFIKYGIIVRQQGFELHVAYWLGSPPLLG